MTICRCGHTHIQSVGDRADAGCSMLGKGCGCWEWKGPVDANTEPGSGIRDPRTGAVHWNRDHRRTCWCGHRFGLHAKVDLTEYPENAKYDGTGACQAFVDDPDAPSLRRCQCQGWDP